MMRKSVGKLFRYIETPAGRNKIVYALGRYIPRIYIGVLILMLVVKFKYL